MGCGFGCRGVGGGPGRGRIGIGRAPPVALHAAIGGEVAFGEVGVGGGEAHEGEEAFGLAIGGGFGGVVAVEPGFEGGLAGAEERGEGGGGGGVVEEDGAGPGHLG